MNATFSKGTNKLNSYKISFRNLIWANKKTHKKKKIIYAYNFTCRSFIFHVYAIMTRDLITFNFALFVGIISFSYLYQK